MRVRQITVMSRRCLPWWACVLLSLTLAGCDERGARTGPVYTAQPAGAEVEKVHHLAIHPLYNPQRLHEVYAPLAEYLNRRVPGLRLEVEASSSYAHYETKLKARAPEFLLPNPYQTLMALDHGYHVLVEMGDSDDFRGIFIVRRDSPLVQPTDLKGKVVSYPAPTALAATMLTQHWLASQGVRVMQEVDNRYVGSQESAILNALHKQSDAAATWPPSWRAFQKEHPDEAAQLKLLWQTPPLINLSIMARADMPADLVRQLREQLLHMHEDPQGASILWTMQARRFYAADGARYRTAVSGFLKDYQARVGPLP